MKKLFFSAMACIAFAGSAFASNEVVSKQDFLLIGMNVYVVEKPCKVHIYVVGPNGNKSWLTGEGGNLSWDDCGKFKDKYISDMDQKGFKLIDDNVTVIWGK